MKIDSSDIGSTTTSATTKKPRDRSDFGQFYNPEFLDPYTRTKSARVAVYGSSPTPSVKEFSAAGTAEFVGLLAASVYELSQEKGGHVPFVALKELVENLIHADFHEVVVSIAQNGNIVKISDQGPGIANKKLALEQGFTSASASMKNFIKGVGSGLAVATAAVKSLGGKLEIEDNLNNNGTVVTLSIPKEAPVKKTSANKSFILTSGLSKRQKKVLFIIVELGAAGPSRIASELAVGLSTAHRDLRSLERLGLIVVDNQGKRSLTDFGTESLDRIITS